VFRVLKTRRWLGALALAVAFCVAAIFLGRWQWHRYEAKDTVADRITAHYHADPVPLRSVLPTPHTGMPASDEWTPVTVTGRYDASSTQLIRNRPNHGVYGYEVLVPLHLQHGGVLLVDRGWVRNAKTAATLPDVPPPPDGRVTVTGWMREGEPNLHRDMPGGQLASINLGQAQQRIDGNVFETYVIMKHEDPANGQPVTRPKPLEQPSTDRGPHLAYALQWWAASIVGFVLVFVGVRRQKLDEDWQREHGGEGTDGGPDAPPPRPKKVRIWDEEDA
jgi:cytochrome oxidase assembly protein ShyY1